MSSFAKVLKGLQEVFGTDEAVAYTLKAAGFEDDGGPGSGNFGHKGRPGLRGGSGEGGGKGSGKAMRTGSKETGYSSFTKTAEFKKLTNLARLRHNKNSVYPDADRQDFWRDVASDSELDKALRAQHKQACPGESYSHYVDRMFNMLVERVDNEKMAPSVDKVLKSLKGDEKLAVHAIQARWGVNPTNLMNKGLPKDKKEFLEILGNHAKWSDRMLDRKFKNLDEQEKKDLNTLLNRYPWSKEMNQARIPNEKALYESESPEVQDYYNALKAKALGIGRVFVPERPDGLDKKDRLGDWRSKLDETDQKWVDMALGERSLPEFLETAGSYRVRRMLDTIARTTDWKERLSDRQFEGLNDKEKKDLNYLLDQFPYGPGSNEPFEDALYDGIGFEITKYYDALKAKELGIEGVKVPEKPPMLEYAQTHKPMKEVLESQDGGYVFTEAGNANRESIKRRLADSEKSILDDSSETFRGYKDSIIASVDSMDDRMAELVNKTLSNAGVSWVDSKGTSHYESNGIITMFTRDINGDPRTNEEVTRTFWHEFGHFVDDGYRSKSGLQFYGNPLMDNPNYPGNNVTQSLLGERRKMYHDAARKDVESLLELAGLADKYRVEEYNDEGWGKLYIDRREDGQLIEFRSPDETVSANIVEIQNGIDKALDKILGYDDVLNFMQKHGAPEEINYEDYVETYTTPKRHLIREREKFPGAKDAYRAARKERDQKWDEWVESLGGQDAYFELAHQRDAAWDAYHAKKKKLGYVTDSLDEAVNGLFGMVVLWGGHGEDYYRQKGAPIETTANMFSARTRNDPDEVDFMQKVIPNISKLFTQAWRANYE